MMILEALLATSVLGGPLEPLVLAEVPLCSVQPLRENPEGYHWPVADIARFVHEADVIVRAVAVGVESDAEPGPYASTVRFRAVEVLTGAIEEDEFVFSGMIVDRSDFNPRPVPYQIVRPSGQRGDCYARDYRSGGEYLFLLREGNGNLTPYWAPLAPTNEEITGEEDPWLRWVRDRLDGGALR